jgi:hypothetical protein
MVDNFHMSGQLREWVIGKDNPPGDDPRDPCLATFSGRRTTVGLPPPSFFRPLVDRYTLAFTPSFDSLV